MVSILARRIDDDLAALIKKVDQAVAENRQHRMATVGKRATDLPHNVRDATITLI